MELCRGGVCVRAARERELHFGFGTPAAAFPCPRGPFSWGQTLVTRMSEAPLEPGGGPCESPALDGARPGSGTCGLKGSARRPLGTRVRPAVPASPRAHSPVLPRLSRSLLGHQDVVLLSRVLLPVGELGALALALLDETWVSRGADAACTPRAPCHACHAHPEQGHLFLLLVVEVFLDVEEGVKEHVGQFAVFQIVERDFPCGT